MDARGDGSVVVTAAWIEELTRPTFRETEHDAEDERARWRRDALRAFEKSLPPLYRWARLDSPLLAERVKLSIPRELPTARSVVFMGPPGIGKTSLAVAMLRAMLEQEMMSAPCANDDDADCIVRRFRFMHAHRLGVARISGAEELAELASATRTPLLLIDDLDRDAKVASNPLSDVVQERHAEQRVTWITTTLTAREIAERYGGGIARRLFENARLIEIRSRECSPIGSLRG